MIADATKSREDQVSEAMRKVEAIAVERWEHAHPDRLPTKSEASALLAEIAAQYYKP
jgi:hypothetical protein